MVKNRVKLGVSKCSRCGEMFGAKVEEIIRKEKIWECANVANVEYRLEICKEVNYEQNKWVLIFS